MRDKLLELLSEKNDLPALPELVLRIDAEMRDEKSDILTIARLIETEPALAGKVLTLSNSAYYGGGRREVTNLRAAITRLGFSVLREIVYTIEMSKLFGETEVVARHMFWKHSVAVALTTQALTKWTGALVHEDEAAYLSGLMHDTGVMVFSYLIPDEYQDFLNNISEEEIPLHTQESEAFGIDHAELGSFFIHYNWRIDESIIQAVRSHHSPLDVIGVDNRIAQLVNIANGICNSQGIINGIKVYSEMFKDGRWESMGLTQEETDNIRNLVKDGIDQAEELLSG